MTNHSPKRQDWIGKLVISMFLLVMGGMANQFFNIPVQQQHQDDRLNAIEKHMEYNDSRFDRIVAQHDILARQLEDLKRLHEETAKEKKRGPIHN